MEKFIDTIPYGPVREWYRKNVNADWLYNVVHDAIKRGYEPDTKSGLLFRKVFDCKKTPKCTILDGIFPRPVDLHHHKDVHEALVVLQGEGVSYVSYGGTPTKRDEVKLFPGKAIAFPKNMSHSFRPDKDKYLEMRLVCSGTLNLKKEICEDRFYSFKPWVDYFK